MHCRPLSYYSCLLFVIFLPQNSPLLYQKGTMFRQTPMYAWFLLFITIMYGHHMTP